MPSSRISLSARVVFPVSGPSVPHGVIEIEDGRILAIHSHPGPETRDLGDVAILPGLVNAHTHLEFSNLTSRLGPPTSFAAWIASVVAERRRRCRRDVSRGDRVELDPIGKGLHEAFATGTAVVADIVTGRREDADEPAPVESALLAGRLIPFRELLSPTDAGVPATIESAREFIRSLPSDVAAALSPHAPYTVTTELLGQSLGWASDLGCPVAMHLAETVEELQFLRHGAGPLAEMLQRIGQWQPDRLPIGLHPLDLLQSLSAAPRALVIHGNYLDEGELRFLAHHPRMSLVYCPRTHEYFGHSSWPLEEALRLGVHVALGTDSRASNPDLNLWEEAKTVSRRFPALPPETVISLATHNGAGSLGVQGRCGVLEVGRDADLCCVTLTGSADDLLRAALHPGSRVVGSMHGGEWVVSPMSPG